MLYFSILKNPRPTPLLPAALHGIARFAHLVNIDFFKDLLQVLKTLMTRDMVNEDDESADGPGPSRPPGPHDASNIATVQHQLLCVVTAFELLSGQGTCPPSRAPLPFSCRTIARAELTSTSPPSPRICPRISL